MLLGKMGSFLAEVTSTVDVATWIESIKGYFTDFSVTNLITIIGAAVGIAVGFVIFWFAYRFIKRHVVKAMKKGTL